MHKQTMLSALLYVVCVMYLFAIHISVQTKWGQNSCTIARSVELFHTMWFLSNTSVTFLF